LYNFLVFTYGSTHGDHWFLRVNHCRKLSDNLPEVFPRSGDGQIVPVLHYTMYRCNILRSWVITPRILYDSTNWRGSVNVGRLSLRKKNIRYERNRRHGIRARMDDLEMRKVTRPIRETNHVHANRRLVTIHIALTRLPSKFHYNF
jgi:hypothetical protein